MGLCSLLRHVAINVSALWHNEEKRIAKGRWANNAGGFEFHLFSFRFCNFMKNKGKFLPLNHYHIKKYIKILY